MIRRHRMSPLRPVLRRAVLGVLQSAAEGGSSPVVQRLTISGTGFVLNGQAWVPYGMSDGHFELTHVGDEAIDVAMGATALRTVVRTYGTYGTGHQQDMQEEGQPGNLKPAYLAEIVRRLTAARAAGMRNGIANDSNKGQGAEASGGNDFFGGLTEGNRQKGLFIGTAVYLAENHGDLIDWMEPLVEPNSAVVASAAVLQAFQEEFMTAVLAVAPHMLFSIGPRDYSSGNIANAIKAAWLVPGNPFYGKVFMTCNFLDNLSMDEAQRVTRAASVATARATAGVPAWINQLATHFSGDPENINLAATMALHDAASGGFLGYNYWERVSMAGTADGLRYLSDIGNPNSTRLTHDARISVVQAHMSGVPYWMTAPAIVGTPTEGELVTYTTGTAAGRPAPTLAAHVWVDGVDKGLASAYTIQAGDVGLPVVVKQAATNTAGVVTSDSAAVNAAAAGGGDTVLSLGMMGGQIYTPTDYTGDAIHNDLNDRGRNIAANAGHPYAESHTPLVVTGLSRTSNVTTVTHEAIANADQTLATGMRVVMTCLADPTFDVDQASITVTNSTHFTYPNTGANATYDPVSDYDIAAAVINSVAVDATSGQPKADYIRVLSTVNGSNDRNVDLNGTYVVTFPGSTPSSVSFTGAGYSGGVLTIDNADTDFITLECTGVATDGSFIQPTIIRSDHDLTGATYLRPDFAQTMSRFAGSEDEPGVMRFMDGVWLNSNASVKTWAKRPRRGQGRGMSIEEMVQMCNELHCHLWICIHHFADDDYIEQMAAYIDANLDAGLSWWAEYCNEEWNDGTFPHLMWNLTRLRVALSANFHGVKDESVITGVSRSGGVVTVNMTRPPPFTNGATAVFKIVTGSSGYDTPDAGAVMTVAGNDFSFTGGSASGAGTCTVATIIGNPTNPIYNWDKCYTFRELATRMHGIRTYEMAQLIDGAIGGLNSRVKVMLMGWNTNFSPFGLLEDFALKYLEAQHGSTKDWLWGIGGAPYPETSVGNTTTAEVKTTILAEIDSQVDYYHRASYLAVRYAHQHIQYEGGPDLSHLGTNYTLIDALYASNDYRDCQEYLLNKVYAYGVDVHVPFYTSAAPPGVQGDRTWGIYRDMTDDGGAIGSATTSRIQGIDNVLLAAPPAYEDPNKLPGTLYYQGGTGYKDDQTGTGATNGMRQLYSGSAQIENLFFVDPENDGEDIVLTIWGGITVGGGANGVRVYLDDTLVGTLNLQTAASLASMASGGAASPTTITLTAVSKGKHRLKIKAPSSQPDEVGVSKVVGV